jgi:hypothetical protein
MAKLRWKGARPNQGLGFKGKRYQPGDEFELGAEDLKRLQHYLDEGSLELLDGSAPKKKKEEAKSEPAPEPEAGPEKGLKTRVRSVQGVGQKAAGEVVEEYPTTEKLKAALEKCENADEFGVGSIGEDKFEALREEFLD